MPTADDPWVLDTHIWIRVLHGDTALALPAFQERLAAQSAVGNLLLSAISLWETAMLVAKGRLALNRDLDGWLSAAVAMPGLVIVPLDVPIVIDSATLPGDCHGDPADRLITATARCRNARLITLDRRILDYAGQGWVRAVSPAEV
jgi:PIN domain nuclease of toxin-antitoxin system